MLLFLLLATSEHVPSSFHDIDRGIELFGQGKNNEAYSFLEKGLQQFDATKAQHLKAKAYLGAVLDELSKHEEAKNTLIQCVENYKTNQPDDKAGLAFVLMHLGKTYSQRGQYENSEKALQESIDLYQGDASQTLNLTKANTLMAETYMYSGAYSQAEPYFKAVIASYAAGDPQILWTGLRLARLYMFTGNYEGAKPIFEEGVSVLKKGTDKDKLGWNLFYLGDVYRSLGLFDQAEQIMTEGFAAFKVCGYAPEHQITQWGQGYFGRLLCDRGEYAKAQPILEESLKVHESLYGENSKRSVFIMQALANAYANLGKFEEAESLLTKSLAVYEKQFGTAHTEHALVLRDYGRLACLQKNYPKAAERLNQALSVLQTAGHSEATRCHAYLQEVQQKLADVSAQS